MKLKTLGWGIMVLVGALVIASGCSEDTAPPTVPDTEPEIGNLPVIPTPSSVNELLPSESEEIVVGMSAELDSFEPFVSRLRVMMDDGSLEWLDQNRHLILACPGVLPVNTGDPAANDPTFIAARPYLLHKRHWRRLEQNTLYPGTSSTVTKTVIWGASTYHEESTEFSQTVGVEVTAGGSWGAFSASVTASYEQTSTSTEVNAVTFSEEESEERSYTVEAPDSGARVYVLWQLVDEFSLVDVDTIPIHQSDILTHVEIPAVANILFPNQNVVTMKTTDFAD